ncbi:hypothetical protein BDY19DRAFT_862269, partial [Irpex rosettiformis]
ITKIVNALTAKSEIGSPMASMYLLNHPDHYTSHTFQRFYWKPYVNENKNGFVGISPVLDYIYRPQKYENISLYNWIRTMNKTKINTSSTEKASTQQTKEWNVEYIIKHNDTGDEENSFESDSDMSDVENSSESNLESLSSLEDEQKHDRNSKLYDNINNKSQSVDLEYYRYSDFLPEHSQYKTHKVQVVSEEKSKVPDFIGLLPRHDRGNREEYCMTMLTFFKPWRVGRDLKLPDQTWDNEFECYDFSQKDRDVMKYFNLRYECNDARDDFSAKRRTQYYNQNGWPLPVDNETTKWLDT